MESKYYTPSIEEFHIGFEYEYDGTGYGVYYRLRVDNIDSFYRVKDDIEFGDVRVKYLDKEDIESLGFICKYEANSMYYTYKESVSLFNSGVWTLKLINWPSEDNIRLTISDASVDDEVIFRGKIRNKSELIKILKQLGVNE